MSSGMKTGVYITSTTVTLPAATSTVVIAANQSRRSLEFIVNGTGQVNGTTFDGTAAVAGTGLPMAAAGGAGQQGGSYGWSANSAPKNEVRMISTAGTTIVVLEGV